jgi:hypothetical protein
MCSARLFQRSILGVLYAITQQRTQAKTEICVQEIPKDTRLASCSVLPSKSKMKNMYKPQLIITYRLQIA